MLTLSTSEKKRMMLFRVAKGNPQIIMEALDEIGAMAKSALEATLGEAKPSVLRQLKASVDSALEKYKETLKSEFEKSSKEFTDKLSGTLASLIAAEVAKIKPPKGDKGDRPSEKEIRDLIKLLMPAPKDGRTPTKEELMAVCKPMMAEMFNAFNKTPIEMAEDEKRFSDKVYGLITKAVGEELGKVKKFSGGGMGDRVKAGSGVTITSDVLGRKVITATGSGAVETPGGTVNSVNATFTVTAEPRWVVADGIQYFDGAGYTYTPLQIVMDIAPSQFIRAII